MKKRFILLVLLAVAGHAKVLKVASYNVENLFDMRLSGLEYQEYIPHRHNWTAAMLEKKLSHIAEVICDMDADVIGLQEIENDTVLQDLQKVLARVGCSYPYRAITHTKQTPIHNALLSKIALKQRRDVTIFRRGKHRSILEVDLKTAPKLKLFVNHWKSKAGPESERIVYAKALMKRIARLPKRSEYLVMGDFNEDYHEYQVIEPKHNDTGGITGINHILKTIQEGNLLRLYALERGYHYNLWLELSRYARWSHNFFGDKEAIDAILIPASLHDSKGWEYKKGSFTVFKPKYLFGKRGSINRWEYRHSRHTGKGYSDHLPIYASFVQGEGDASIESGGMWETFLSYFSSSEKELPPQKVLQTNVVKKELHTGSITELIAMEAITVPMRLKDVKVIWKSGDSAVIKQSTGGSPILLYRCAEALETGKRYDLTVYQKKRYNGLEELTDIAVERVLGHVDIAPYLLTFSPKLMQEKRFVNEVISGLEGRYKKYKIILEGAAYPIYFKKGIKRPKEGEEIRILRAQIGYYKGYNELVIWDEKDYQTME